MWIDSLNSNEVFVYGANEAGRHGAGAAKQAMKWGAKYGEYGFNGNTYGIPTKDAHIITLPLERIHDYVCQFILFAGDHPELTFLMTEIGCGLAGYTPEQIAPMFKIRPDNVKLNERFLNVLKKEHEQV